MIAQLTGTIVEKNPAQVVIDCGGVGYLLYISLNTFEQIPETPKVMLYTHLIVREDAHLLYGFTTTTEREIFKALISVSGIGASIA
ncbi:MAG: Holliday junction branch migration protein RuvA, partial [Flavobacteriaceae bacterium]|nr:Holliday junction branch migration protein RuvA [Flavobacteriaceae bacterium]